MLQAMYPMHDMIRGKVFQAPPPDTDLFAFAPTIHLVSRTPLGKGPLGQVAGGQCRAGQMERLDLEMKLPQPGVGVLNVTGNIQGWSFSDPLPKSFAKVRCSDRQELCKNVIKPRTHTQAPPSPSQMSTITIQDAVAACIHGAVCGAVAITVPVNCWIHLRMSPTYKAHPLAMLGWAVH